MGFAKLWGSLGDVLCHCVQRWTLCYTEYPSHASALALLHRTPQEGRVGTGAGGNRPPLPLLLGPNFSVSHILIWNNYLSCIVMEGCILFPVVPAKGTWY